MRAAAALRGSDAKASGIPVPTPKQAHRNTPQPRGETASTKARPRESDGHGATHHKRLVPHVTAACGRALSSRRDSLALFCPGKRMCAPRRVKCEEKSNAIAIS